MTLRHFLYLTLMSQWLSGNLRIHIWGGLGSQLFALATALDLKFNTRHKDLTLVLHNGGVTLRESEINLLTEDFPVELISDFMEPTGFACDTNSFSLRKIASRLFKYLGVIDSLDSRKYPLIWAISLRGHYTYRRVNEMALTEIIQRMAKISPGFGEPVKKTTAVGIQYRLGDLEFLSTKHFVEPIRILKLLEKLSNSHVHVYSDSLDSARNKLNLAEASFFDLSAIETISKLISYHEFIGTNSKISQWVVLFRLYFASDARCWLPIEFKDQFYRSLPASITPTNLFFY